MRRFNAPPGWPPPPNARWRPPKGWSPPPTWPEAPAGWAYWIDEHGRRVPGPFGRYGGPSRIWLVAAVAAVVVLPVGAGLAFGDDGSGGAASDPPVTSGGDRTATQSTTPTPAGSPTPRVSPSSSDRTPAPFVTSRPLPSESASVPTSVPTSSATPSPTPSRVLPTASLPTQVVYKNCSAVRAAGKAPLLRGQPGYSTRLDRNGDGVACERGNS